MSSRAEAAPRRPANLSRTSHPTPWARPAGRQLAQPRVIRRVRPAPPPVFVDDSGRRRRAGRLVGTCVAALVLSYLAVVGLTFSGAPLIGRLAPPGVDELSRPAGDAGLGMGSGAQESPLPSPAAEAQDGTPDAREVAQDDAVGPAATTAPSAVSTTTTTTTVQPGQSTNSTVPTPSSTVPEHTHPTGGPPTEPPGKP